MTTTCSIPRDNFTQNSRLDKDSVLNSVLNAPEQFYGRYTQLSPRSGGRFVGRCPIHQGDAPNFWVYPSGRWKCYSGCNKGGDAIIFAVTMHKCDFKAALTIIAEGSAHVPVRDIKPVQPTAIKEIDQSLAHKFHDTLVHNQRLLAFLLNKRGLTKNAVYQYKIGCVMQRGFWRFTFPVYDLAGKLITIRCHLMPYSPQITEEIRKAQGKVRPLAAGYGSGVFGLGRYPAIQPTGHLVEGEADTALMGNTRAVCAYSSTLGQHNFTDTDLDALQSLGHTSFSIWADGDSVGGVAAVKLAHRLSSRNIESRICQIPMGYKDYTAYYVGERGKK